MATTEPKITKAARNELAHAVRRRYVAATGDEALDPLQLLEEIRTMQSHLVVLADGGQPYEAGTGELNLAGFLADLSSAWHAGEIRPTHLYASSTPRYLRRIQIVPPMVVAVDEPRQAAPTAPSDAPGPRPRTQDMVWSGKGTATKKIETTASVPTTASSPRRISRPKAFDFIWPEICRRLNARPTLNASELFDQLRAEYPGRYAPGQLMALLWRVRTWRLAAVAKGIIVRPLHHRTSGRPRTYRTHPDVFASHWPELCQHLETDPDQTGRELFAELRSRYPDEYLPGQLRTLQRRLQVWRQQVARRLVFGVQDRAFTLPPSPSASGPEAGEGGAAPPPPAPLSTPILLDLFPEGRKLRSLPSTSPSGKMLTEATGKEIT
jgi:hypothetical protein